LQNLQKGGPTCWGSSQQKWLHSQDDDFKPFSPAAPDGSTPERLPR
jgi:hypothetical protein